MQTGSYRMGHFARLQREVTSANDQSIVDKVGLSDTQVKQDDF